MVPPQPCALPVTTRSHSVTWQRSREPADAVATTDLVSGSGRVVPPVFPARERGRMGLCSRTGLRSHGAERPRRTGMNHGCREGPLSQHPMLASGHQGDVRLSPPPPLPCPPAQDCQVRWCRLCPVQGRPARSACQVVCLSERSAAAPLLMCARALEWEVGSPGSSHLGGARPRSPCWGPGPAQGQGLCLLGSGL